MQMFQISIFVLLLFLQSFPSTTLRQSQDKQLREQSNPDIIWVDNFDQSKINQLPADWKGRKKKASKYYKVVHANPDSSNHVLSAHTKDSDMFIIKKVKVDIAQYPFLNWKWRGC